MVKNSLWKDLLSIYSIVNKLFPQKQNCEENAYALLERLLERWYKDDYSNLCYTKHLLLSGQDYTATHQC